MDQQSGIIMTKPETPYADCMFFNSLVVNEVSMVARASGVAWGMS